MATLSSRILSVTCCSAIGCALAWGVLPGRAAAQATVAEKGQEEKGAELPIKRVVMFSSGVAFFEHSGEVEGNAKVDLQFNVKDVNDLLKSMVLQDLGGGKISTVSYGSKDPITRTLQTFAIDLTRNPTLADLLSQIRGEKIEIDAPAAISGTILGVERREVKRGESAIEVDFLNLLTDDGLKSVSLENIGRIKLSNPKLDGELRQALRVLAMSHDTDKKSVTLNFLGEKKRPVRVGYIQESPIWKTSYRLVLDEETPPLLQGWAIVENTTENDWNNVELTLISGRPISFIMDLYQPLYVNRPVVQQELYASLTPRTYDQDLDQAEREFAENRTGEQLESLAKKDSAFDARRKSDGEFAKRPADGDFRYLEEKQKGMDKPLNFAQGVRSVAQAGNVGEMFKYSIATPVKLQRARSAMLPIVNESVEGEKVSIYNPATHVKHPLHGLKLKNSTPLHLMQGPITVFDGGAYAGDAQIQDLPPASERLISYAMDLDCEVAPTGKSDPQQLTACRFVKGIVHTTFKHARSQSYVVKNSGKKAKNVLVEYPLDTAWTLVTPKEATEKTRDMYRFAVAAEPGKPASLDVREERTINEQVHINNIADGTISFYLGSIAVSEKVKEALREVVKRKGAIGEVLRKRQELERQITIIGQEQNRIRGNMEQLPKDSDLFRRYIKKFTEQEDAIETLREQVTASITEETNLRVSLDKFLIGLDVQ